MAKIVFFFAGTGDSAKNYKDSNKDINFNADVIQVYVSGCQHQNVGGGWLFPDLEKLAEKIYKSFHNQTINLETLQQELGDAVEILKPSDLNEDSVQIDSIGLEGFSRGAVATFAVAKKMNPLNIDMYIMANQPVPGEESEKRKVIPSMYAQYHDLSECHNIKSATMMLASHDLRNHFLQNIFFKQMTAKFHENTSTNTFLIPYQYHLQSKEHHLE